MKRILFLLGAFFTTVVVYAQIYGFETPVNDKWLYNASSNVYYIVGISYCATPAIASYEHMGIFVPGAFMHATPNGNGTYTCTINTTATINGYTALTAPIVLPVNTPGYSAMAAPTGYSSAVATFTNEGFIYLWPGCRGKAHGAPLGVVDLKAAIRYFRYLQAVQNAVPGNANRMFSFGMSGGGAQSAILGASGNCSLFNPYLNTIGAKSDYPDNIFGSMCWCPVTSLELGDGAHEWNMGLTRNGLTTADRSISKGLASEFASYVNAIGFKHPSNGSTLSLSSTANGYFQKGSYYSYVMEVINDAIVRYNGFNGTNIPKYSTTDSSALFAFSSQYKAATKGLGAYDNYISLSTPENQLFGISGATGHFDQYLAPLINLYAPNYYPSFVSDLASTNVDSHGRTVQQRLMMYSPLFYLISNNTYYSGGGTGSSNVAPYWRIRSGIKQSDAPLNTEINLALALKNYNGVADVDFKTIWGVGHAQAEENGTANANFIQWVHSSVAAPTGLLHETSGTPSTFQLSQNKPNPFYPTTSIAFSIPETSHVTLKIYDCMGREAATLVQETKSAGNYSVLFNASSLPNGMYYCRLHAGNYAETRKLVVQK